MVPPRLSFNLSGEAAAIATHTSYYVVRRWKDHSLWLLHCMGATHLVLLVTLRTSRIARFRCTGLSSVSRSRRGSEEETPGRALTTPRIAVGFLPHTIFDQHGSVFQYIIVTLKDNSRKRRCQLVFLMVEVPTYSKFNYISRPSYQHSNLLAVLHLIEYNIGRFWNQQRQTFYARD